MNVRRRSKIREMLEQIVPYDEPFLGEEFASEEALSFIAFLRQWQEDPAFLEVFERLWTRLLSPEMAPDPDQAAQPFRVFTEEEGHRLSTEARGYLVKLHTVGLLDPMKLEKVMDRALECWAEEVTLDQVRFLVAAVLLHEVFSTHGFDQQFSVPPLYGLD